MATLLTLHSPRLVTVDALRQEQASAAVQVLGIVGFALLTALGAQVRIYLWEVPITLQTLFVYGSGLAKAMNPHQRAQAERFGVEIIEMKD